MGFGSLGNPDITKQLRISQCDIVEDLKDLPLNFGDVGDVETIEIVFPSGFILCESFKRRLKKKRYLKKRLQKERFPNRFNLYHPRYSITRKATISSIHGRETDEEIYVDVNYIIGEKCFIQQ